VKILGLDTCSTHSLGESITKKLFLEYIEIDPWIWIELINLRQILPAPYQFHTQPIIGNDKNALSK